MHSSPQVAGDSNMQAVILQKGVSDSAPAAGRKNSRLVGYRSLQEELCRTDRPSSAEPDTPVGSPWGPAAPTGSAKRYAEPYTSIYVRPLIVPSELKKLGYLGDNKL